MFGGLHRPGFPSSARNSLHLNTYPIQYSGIDPGEQALEDIPVLRILYPQRRWKKPIESISSWRMIKSGVTGIWVHFLCCPPQLHNSHVFECKFFCTHTNLQLGSEKELCHPCFVWSVPNKFFEERTSWGSDRVETSLSTRKCSISLASCGKIAVKDRLGTFSVGFSNRKVFH